ncbi:hypothetical protein [Sedimentisphaera salicampi]|uniref:hypothetical protein n=1 Tax=Sedimentisphaera salicampi TaxID=1941349 RepID=UPI000B9BBCF1|nr:hypothetical protein [Sedimentisphaera salicampi]OXU15722.1 hypothetical protein SMSP1_00509 [Sedimentisphaera salicampi]
MDILQTIRDSESWLQFVQRAGFSEPEFTFIDYLSELGILPFTLSEYADMDSNYVNELILQDWKNHKEAYIARLIEGEEL